MEETLYVDVREDYFIYKKTNIVESSFNLDLIKAAQNRMQHIYWNDKSAFVCMCCLNSNEWLAWLQSSGKVLTHDRRLNRQLRPMLYPLFHTLTGWACINKQNCSLSELIYHSAAPLSSMTCTHIVSNMIVIGSHIIRPRWLQLSNILTHEKPDSRSAFFAQD